MRPTTPLPRRAPPAAMLAATLAAMLASALAAAGCDDGAAAARGPLVGTYVLRTVDGRALPVTTSTGRGPDGATEATAVLDQRYEFAADGGARLATRVRVTSGRAPRDTVVTAVGDLRYRREGDRVVIGPRTPCPPNALCPADFEGRLVGTSRLVVEYPNAAARRWEYEAAR